MHNCAGPERLVEPLERRADGCKLDRQHGAVKLNAKAREPRPVLAKLMYEPCRRVFPGARKFSKACDKESQRHRLTLEKFTPDRCIVAHPQYSQYPDRATMIWRPVAFRTCLAASNR